ncbi:MAG: LysR family transcriptional regulator, partial [Eubacterium sp.]|nr:LysR family transcriptional regulator [Eubacterium sp.]
MDIRVLQYFLAVSREESITKAAEALRMTQPPLSRQLKDLEAEELVDLMEKTKAELASSNENINGEIHIG